MIENPTTGKFVHLKQGKKTILGVLVTLSTCGRYAIISVRQGHKDRKVSCAVKDLEEVKP